MTLLSPAALAALGLLLALWLGLAGWATLTGLRRRARARAAERQVVRLAGLVETAPAVPLLVYADGRLEGPPRLARRLGLMAVPQTLDLFAGALPMAPGDMDGLRGDIAASRVSAASFDRPLRMAGSDRVLLAVGGPAGADIAANATLIWFFDATGLRREIDRLEHEVTGLGQALDSLAALIEAAPLPMWHRATDRRLDLVNSAYVRAVEARDAGEVIDRGMELIEGDPAPTVGPDPGGIAVRTLPATVGGERRTLRVVDVALGASGFAGYAVDVEELEEARADLDRFGRAQRELLDRLSAGVVQFGPDQALTFYNQPFSRLFGLDPASLDQEPEFDRVLERMRETGRLPESRDFPRWKEERRRWFQAEQAAAVEEHWLLPGGMHLRVVPQPLPDGGLLLIFEDRTEQVKLESARDTLLRVRTATFNNLFEAIGVFAYDGRLNLWNDRFGDVWGLSEEQLAEHPRIDALVPIVAKRLVNPSRAGLIRELVRIATVERQQRSGRVMLADGRHFQFAAVPLPDGNALFTMLDITDSRRIEHALRERTEALEEGDRIKTAFVANMSYELRTPLTSISGFTEMLAAGFVGPLTDRQRDYVQAILTSVARLSTLIDDVLDLTQAGDRELPLVEEEVDIELLARQAGEQVEETASAKRIDLVLAISPLAGSVTGDARRLRQSVDHVLRNAVAYTQEGGRVMLEATGDPVEARITVSDDGPGIPEHHRPHVFDRFHRVSVADDRKDRSLGLGLPLSRQFVEAHGGTVELSTEPGRGTTVTITLPRRRQRQSA